MPSPSEIARQDELNEPAEPSANGGMEPASTEEQYLAKQHEAAKLSLVILHRERELAQLKSQLTEINRASADLLRDIKGEPKIPEQVSKSLDEFFRKPYHDPTKTFGLDK